MMSRHVFKALDRMLRDIMRQEHIPFGGKVVVLGGDFWQCLLVIPRAREDTIVDMSLRVIDFLDQVTILRLRGNMRVLNMMEQGNEERARELQNWVDFLRRVGDGTEPKIPEDDPHLPGWIQAPAHIARNSRDEEEFIRDIYGSYEDMATYREGGLHEAYSPALHHQCQGG